jgi:AcrR family transcriptional regulator
LRLADKLGPERLTTDAIANAVGLTQPGIFRHFPKKQDLWEAVAARVGAMMEANWTKAHEPRRVCRRLIWFSYAAMASVSRAA